MADTHETIDDIVAEKRALADRLEHEMAVAKECKELIAHRTAQAIIDSTRREADRLEAAHKRERGDCAKLREAAEKTRATLEEALQILNGISDEEAGRLNARIEDVADAICEVTESIIPDALAAPPRNCDIYLTEEAVDAATVTVRDCEACSRIDMEAPCVFCMVRWLLAPATEKEGGAK